MSVFKKFVGQFSTPGYRDWYETEREAKKTFPYTICICGHPSSKHLAIKSEMLCLINKCRCPELIEVIAVSDPKPFQRFANNLFGHRGPLGKGVKLLTESGGTYVKVLYSPCSICGEDSDSLDVMSSMHRLTHLGGNSFRDSKRWFICENCAAKEVRNQ